METWLSPAQQAQAHPDLQQLSVSPTSPIKSSRQMHIDGTMNFSRAVFWGFSLNKSACSELCPGWERQQPAPEGRPRLKKRKINKKEIMFNLKIRNWSRL